MKCCSVLFLPAAMSPPDNGLSLVKFVIFLPVVQHIRTEMTRLCLFLVLFCVTLCLTKDAEGNQKCKTWDGLKVLATPNSFPSAYSDLPKTKLEAEQSGWSPINQQCQGSKFLGFRYAKKEDVSRILIFDVKGYIAGVQTTIPKIEADKNGIVDYSNSKNVFADSIFGNDVYVMTAYFIDPEKICRGGRSAKEFEQQLTGKGLYLQNGSDPIANSERQFSCFEKGVTKLGWVKSACVPISGQLYHNDFRADKPCKDLSGFFIFYNDGGEKQLMGFGFYFFGNYSRDNFYFPVNEQLQKLPEPLPSCFFDSVKKAGLAIAYFFITKNPLDFTCSD